MSKFMDGNKKIEEAVVSGYKAIETGVVTGYKAIEDGVVGGYKKIEDRFVKAFLTPDDAPSQEKTDAGPSQQTERGCGE